MKDFDPETYQVLAPYPYAGKIKEQIKAEICDGQVKVPPNQILKIEKFIDELVAKRLVPIKTRYTRAENAARNQFRADMEEYWDFANFPDEVKSKIHYLAWERGHACGYSEVRNQYDEFVELATICLKHKP
jgi:hypothetical protein